MKSLKKILSSLILCSPVALMGCAYGPAPYIFNCQKDNDCNDYPDGQCKIQNGVDDENKTGGFCGYPCWDDDSSAYWCYACSSADGYTDCYDEYSNRIGVCTKGTAHNGEVIEYCNYNVSDSSSDSNSDAGSDSDADAGSDNNADSGSDAGSDSNSDN